MQTGLHLFSLDGYLLHLFAKCQCTYREFAMHSHSHMTIRVFTWVFTYAACPIIL